MLLGLALEAAVRQVQVNWQHEFQAPAVCWGLGAGSAGSKGNCQEASLRLLSLGVKREAE